MNSIEHLRIVVVDDHAGMRSSIRGILESQSGWEVCGEARDGIEAVEQVKSLAPDVVVMDFMMPRRNGLEATRDIAAIAPRVGIVIVTMDHLPELSRKVKEAGASSLVLKGESEQKLIPAVRVASYSPAQREAGDRSPSRGCH
jgi:DNA-binding NarL/FixJ family response regulator